MCAMFVHRNTSHAAICQTTNSISKKYPIKMIVETISTTAGAIILVKDRNISSMHTF